MLEFVILRENKTAVNVVWNKNKTFLKLELLLHFEYKICGEQQKIHTKEMQKITNIWDLLHVDIVGILHNIVPAIEEKRSN